MAFSLKEISAFEARSALLSAGLSEVESAEFLSANCATFALDNGAGTGVAAIEKNGPELWVHAFAAKKSSGLASDGLVVAEAIASKSDCQFVRFKTARPGLVKIAKKQGYRIAAFVMEKKV